ncbi:MAG: Tol-Pal system beta propeller repeat protein TolB [Candidatus Aminicenantes bacterium]|nr:MAG: Tol-Pal system beta propeller repeat protein TolB [Candidatus Aminicenantes bacterium]
MTNRKVNKSIFLLLIAGLIFTVFFTRAHAQQEVRIRISEGMPMIPVALPEFQLRETSVPDQKTKQEIYQVLQDDLKYSRVFKLVPKEYYSYIQEFDPGNIRFKDWASIQANILISGSIEVSAQDRVVFAMKAYDVRSEKFIFGRNFGGKKEFTRLIAHRAADEMMKYFGEKPIFTSKVIFVTDRDGNNEIYMMDYDGKRVRRITHNNDLDILPTWSADNEKILYTSYRKNNPDLYMFHLYTGKTELIATGQANYAADWCLEDDNIVYTSTRSGNAEIYVKNMKTGKEKRVTFNPAIDTTPCWSPSGDEIVFTSQRSGTPQIYIMNADGTNIRRITHDGSYYDSPAWSPDSTRIAYVSRIEYRFDIYVYNLKDNTVVKMTEQSGRNENPTWSPDGRHLIFASNRSGSYQLYSIDYDGTNLRQLTFKGENKMPEWQKK